jgi:imidazolonepropionase-like amidohydrolase
LPRLDFIGFIPVFLMTPAFVRFAFRLFFPLFFLCCFLGCEQRPPLPEPAAEHPGEIVFRQVNVVPMYADTVLQKQDVVVRDGIIAAMGDSGTLRWSDSALVIDAAGKFLMPGLAEMHAHVPPENDPEAIQETLWLFALNGVTTIRGMLGHPLHIGLRDDIRDGKVFGPRLYTAGPALAGDDIQTAESARAEVLRQKEAGYDFLKILMPALPKEAFDAVVATAREQNIPFAGHVPSTVGVQGAIEAGYASIDHLDGFVESLVPGIETMSWNDVGLFGLFVADRADTTRIPGLIQALKTQGIWVVPTQCLSERWFDPGDAPGRFLNAPETVYMSSDDLKEWADLRDNVVKSPNYNPAVATRLQEIRRRLVYECQKGGVGLLLGSDAPQVYNVPGFSAHAELVYLTDAGLTPYEALRTGTVHVGQFLKRPDIGVVRPGARAELILLKNNPLENVRHTRSIEGVLLGKRWMPEPYIAETLKKLEKR